MNNIRVLILAAGLGTRMKSNQAKVLHKLAGFTLIEHVCRSAFSLVPNKLIVVVGHQSDLVSDAVCETVTKHKKKHLSTPKIEIVLQEKQLGTGHAVLTAKQHLIGCKDTIIILSGDVPLIQQETITELLNTHYASQAVGTVLSTHVENPNGYGRIIRGNDGVLKSIVEQRDASLSELQINEINTGIYAFESEYLLTALNQLSPTNTQKEYYLTDVIHILSAAGHKVSVFEHNNSEEVLGINSRIELASAARYLRQSKLTNLMQNGVTIVDPDSTYVDIDVQIGMDSIIYPNVIIEGDSQIGQECIIHPGVHLSNANVGNNSIVRSYSIICDSQLENNTSVGPFAHLRSGTCIQLGGVVGNFVEMKKTTLGKNSKAMHLSYLGDATIGSKVNIGAGTITCNYDGKSKHKTVIEDNVKIGSDTMLVAPIKIGQDSVTGAGSVVIEDVPNNSLVVGVPAKIKKHFKLVADSSSSK